MLLWHQMPLQLALQLAQLVCSGRNIVGAGLQRLPQRVGAVLRKQFRQVLHGSCGLLVPVCLQVGKRAGSGHLKAIIGL